MLLDILEDGDRNRDGVSHMVDDTSVTLRPVAKITET